MSTNYHDPIQVGAPANASTVNFPLGQLDEAIGNVIAVVFAATNPDLLDQDPITPDTFNPIIVVEGHILQLGTNDASYTHPLLSGYEIHMADDASGTNEVDLGFFTRYDMPATNRVEGTKWYKIRSVDWVGRRSAYTVWTQAVIDWDGSDSDMVWDTNYLNYGSINLNWHHNYTQSIDHFVLYRNNLPTVDLNAETIGTLEWNVTSFNFPYAYDDKYYFGIKAVALDGLTESSVIWTSSIDPADAPAPANFTADLLYRGTAKRVDLDWDAVSGYSNRYLVRGIDLATYDVPLQSLTGTNWETATLPDLYSYYAVSLEFGYDATYSEYILGQESLVAPYASLGSPAAPVPNLVMYTEQGFSVTWSWSGSQLYFDHFNIYRNNTNDKDGNETLVAETTGNSIILPYNNDGDYFGIEAVYIGGGSTIVWTSENDPTPGTPTLFVNQGYNGYSLIVDNTYEDRTSYYVIQSALLSNPPYYETNIYVGSSDNVFIPQDFGTYYIFRMASYGYDGTYSDFTEWDVDDNAPAVPSTFRADNATEGHLLAIDMDDPSIANYGFRYWQIEAIDYDDYITYAPYGETYGQLWMSTYADDLGYFGATNLPYLREFGIGTETYYRARAIDWVGNESNWTDWDDAIAGVATIKDLFDEYGGDVVSDLESLWWLKIADFGANEAWTTSGFGLSGTVTDETTIIKEGSVAKKLTPTVSGPNYIGAMSLSVSLDLSNDNRFSDNDYIAIQFYASGIGVGTELVRAIFATDASNTFTATFSDYTAGWNYKKVKKSDFSQTGSPDWGNITLLYITINISTADYYIFDDWRVVKADPSDATTYNDTGNAWDKAVNTGTDKGEWHIYEGNRTGEPSKPYSYGQIKTGSSVWYLTHKPLNTTQIFSGSVQAGVYFKDADGQAGLSFYAKDVDADNWNMYVVEADSDADTITLAKYVDGTRTQIAQASFTIDTDEILWLGANFTEYDASGRIKVYASATEGNLIQASNLVLSEVDTQWLGDSGGSVGLLSKQCNVRFVNFSAGSPSHAEMADFARYADVAKSLDSGAIHGKFVGELFIWPTNTAPSGSLLCYGQAVSRTTYSALFAIIGTTFGVGDGSTTFNVPDLRGRTPLGQDDMGGASANRVTHAQADILGGSEGEESHTLATPEMPAHDHLSGGADATRRTLNTTAYASSGYGALWDNTTPARIGATSIQSDGGGGAHNNMQPYLTINYCIYTGV